MLLASLEKLWHPIKFPCVSLGTHCLIESSYSSRNKRNVVLSHTWILVLLFREAEVSPVFRADSSGCQMGSCLGQITFDALWSRLSLYFKPYPSVSDHCSLEFWRVLNYFQPVSRDNCRTDFVFDISSSKSFASSDSCIFLSPWLLSVVLWVLLCFFSF